MKTAISIPDGVFEEVEEFAKSSQMSRSQLFTVAVSEYINRHAPDRVTTSMNEALKKIDESGDEFAAQAANKILQDSEW